jgi:hypothetical protein
MEGAGFTEPLAPSFDIDSTIADPKKGAATTFPRHSVHAAALAASDS